MTQLATILPFISEAVLQDQPLKIVGAMSLAKQINPVLDQRDLDALTRFINDLHSYLPSEIEHIGEMSKGCRKTKPKPAPKPVLKEDYILCPQCTNNPFDEEFKAVFKAVLNILRMQDPFSLSVIARDVQSLVLPMENEHTLKEFIGDLKDICDTMNEKDERIAELEGALKKAHDALKVTHKRFESFALPGTGTDEDIKLFIETRDTIAEEIDTVCDNIVQQGVL